MPHSDKKKKGVLHSEKRRIEKKIAAFGKYNLYLSREAYTRIIVIDLIIVKLFGVCPVVFSLQRERVFYVNICILVYDYYFGLLIFVIILFGTQQVVLEPG